jgi:hypothetical protein
VDTYLNTYGDLKAAFGGLPTAQKRVAAFEHYLDSGAAEGRNFSEDFRWTEYKELYADLKAAFDNTTEAYLLHWLIYGKIEGRIGRRQPAFTTQPASTMSYTGASTTLSVAATYATDYQWYVGAAGDTNNPISGATGASYTTPALSSSTSYWVRISNPVGSTASATATITLAAPTLTNQPASVLIAGGTTTTLSVNSPNAVSYQWYLGTSGDTTNPISGANTVNFTTPVLNSNTSYWVKVTNPNGSTDSETTTVTVTYSPPSIITQPASVTIRPNEDTTTLAVTATAATSYQWYIGTTGDTANPISGATEANYTTPVLSSITTSYWVRVTNPIGSTNSTTAKVQISFIGMATGYAHSLFLKSNGTVWATGNNFSGELGTGDNTNRATPVQVMSGVSAVAAGYAHSLFLKSDGTVWAAGSNGSGQLGTGDTANQMAPVQVMSGVSAIVAGESHSLFLKSDGTVWATGSNYHGQLGTGYNTNRTTPIQVLSEVVSMATSSYHSLFRKRDGTVWATGYNSYGQLGTGYLTYSLTIPMQVFSEIRAVTAGYYHSFFLNSDGTLLAAGSNYSGQLGTGDNTNRTTPIQVLSGVSEVASRYSHSLFLKSDGTIWATGSNYFGQLGTGDQTDRTTPIPVTF